MSFAAREHDIPHNVMLKRRQPLISVRDWHGPHPNTHVERERVIATLEQDVSEDTPQLDHNIQAGTDMCRTIYGVSDNNEMRLSRAFVSEAEDLHPKQLHFCTQL